ncbi:UPF0496 protein 1-like [Actinidia eriantha]|uniref:UPF0496 protein 1-like n=1 Tax=Actinidia eriantha TaxID=165200 RepID=UPI002583F2B0|nr:UPF0496 protein 1-like [Actinidia eriantha]
MGSQFSRRSGDSSHGGSHNSAQSSSNSPLIPDLSSYELACQLDPELRSFDSSLQQRTSRVISTLAVGVEVRSLSLDSLREVTDCLLEMNQEVVNVILDCKKDIWKSHDLFDLVKEYFENSLLTLDFCTALENCLKRARDSQLIVQVALQKFEEEHTNGEECYAKTLQELRNFKAAGDPFTEEFFSLFRSVHRQQMSMLQKLQVKKKKLDKKLKSLKSWRKVSNVIFAATFASVLICSVVAAAIAAPPVITALAAAASVPLGSMGKWFNSLWKKYENEVRGEREIISSMQIGTYIAIKDFDSVRVLVDKLEIEMEGLLQNADFAVQDKEMVVLAIDEIKKNLNGFMQTIDDLGEHTDKFSRHIRRARTVILQRIIKYPTNG